MPISECRLDSDISKIADPFCIPNSRIDGNDVLEVFETGKRFVEFSRAGHGPAFIECLTYRYRGHVGPDDNVQGEHTDIRPEEEILEWMNRDPLSRMEKYLLEEERLTVNEIESIKSGIEEQVGNAHNLAKSSPLPLAGDLMKYVCAPQTTSNF